MPYLQHMHKRDSVVLRDSMATLPPTHASQPGCITYHRDLLGHIHKFDVSCVPVMVRAPRAHCNLVASPFRTKHNTLWQWPPPMHPATPQKLLINGQRNITKYSRYRPGLRLPVGCPKRTQIYGGPTSQPTGQKGSSTNAQMPGNTGHPTGPVSMPPRVRAKSNP